jgi:sugar/nucleoside kinase (ribokinase family)
MNRIAVLSHVVIDEVHPAHDGQTLTEIGGAGAYAATGASLAYGAASAMLVSGIGSADRGLLTGWCGDRGIDSSGLFDVSEHSPRTHIQYFADGERVEAPVYGLDHFYSHTPLPRHIPAPPEQIAGVYLFHDHDPAYWGEIAEYRALSAAPFLWEISLDSCRPDARSAVFDRLGLVDVLSINRTEALSLLGATSLHEAIAALRSAPVTTVLRLGDAGSLVIDGGQATLVGVAQTDVVDPTGGGNSYSGAFLAAFVDSGDAVSAARIAAAAAGLVIAGPGAPRVDDDARDRIRTMALTIPTERRPSR